MKNNLWLLAVVAFFCSCGGSNANLSTTASHSDLLFERLATSWDEGMPLGNAQVGALVWKKGDNLRFSLDRTDLWDLRPIDSISGPNYRFSWVQEQVAKEDYLPVQKKFDHPYDAHPAPSKIPGAALEFALTDLGDPNSVQLYLNNALCEVKWPNGTTLQTFVQADEPVGWFVFQNLESDLLLNLVTPRYSGGEAVADAGPVSGLDLRRLGYKQGEITTENQKITYHQKGWGDFFYDVTVEWKKEGSTLYGVWSITTSLVDEKSEELTKEALTRGLSKDYASHMDYWNGYWANSSISLPDSVLQKQYDNEMYKFASSTREHSYPISLQSVWTADNGQLPPWKGDYHHDLNTQLSYWPTYIGNHLKEGMGYLNTLWNQRDTYRAYTKQFFEVDGINVPGVCTLEGVPMGGWIQYAMSPTVSAWLSYHFYLHWKYSGDNDFLATRAYPFMYEVATYLEQLTVVDKQGVRKLPLSSSPEMFNNSIQAWFKTMSNYDLALTRFAFKAASEMATILGKADEAKHWNSLEMQLPAYNLDSDGGLTIAEGYPFEGSHRHFSHAMAIHPLGLLDLSDGDVDNQKIIQATVDRIANNGPSQWTGYSYAWMANLQARVFDGEKACSYLRDFANHFCLPNTFHANGDQTNSGKSMFTYRPFTLEGNFAFAAGIQEMLLQSHAGYIHIFPAIPASWDTVGFDKLRAMGAFLISANKVAGRIEKLSILSEQGNELTFLSPFEKDTITINGKSISVPADGKVTIPTEKGKVYTIS